jgi:hypothetical protein
MDDDIGRFGTEIGHHALQRNWTGVHQMLAPWLQHSLSVDDVRTFFENAYREILQGNRIQDMHYPEYPDPELGGNSFTNATKLRQPLSFQDGRVRAVPLELTDENFRYWLMVQLQCSDEQMEALAAIFWERFGWPWSRRLTVFVSATGAKVRTDFFSYR